MGNLFARRNISELNLFGTGNVFTQDQLDEYQARKIIFNHFIFVIILIIGLYVFYKEGHTKVITRLICILYTKYQTLIGLG